MARNDFTTDDTHDPNSVYLGSSKDDHGHSSNPRVKIPSIWSGAIQALIDSPDWPEYSSMTVFIRDAIYHRMQWAYKQKNRQPDREQLTAIAFRKTLDEANARRETFQGLREEFDRSCRAARDDGDLETIHDIVNDWRDRLDEVPEQYRYKFEADLDDWEKRAHR